MNIWFYALDVSECEGKMEENQPGVRFMLHGIKKHLCHILSYELLTMICA